MHRPEDHVGAEQAAEEHDLREDKDPHAQLARSELVLGRIEMMGHV